MYFEQKALRLSSVRFHPTTRKVLQYLKQKKLPCVIDKCSLEQFFSDVMRTRYVQRQADILPRLHLKVRRMTRPVVYTYTEYAEIGLVLESITNTDVLQRAKHSLYKHPKKARRLFNQHAQVGEPVSLDGTVLTPILSYRRKQVVYRLVRCKREKPPPPVEAMDTIPVPDGNISPLHISDADLAALFAHPIEV